jgi:hypothetical protein
VTVGDIWRRFSRWRHRRPFWGGLFLLLSAAELFFTANQTLAGLSVHLGPTGFLSYLLPLILVVCGLLCWFSPAQRLFYGIVGLLAALYSFIGLNLGGFFIGMLIGIIGGALVIAWGPPRVRPENPDFVPIADQVGSSAETTDEYQTVGDPTLADPTLADPSLADPSLVEHVDAEPGEDFEVAGHDDRPAGGQVRPGAAPETEIVPGFDDDQEGPKSGSRRSSRLSKNPKALTVALIVVGLTAGLLAVGSRVPASAAECPKGMPSRSTAATSTTAAARKAAAGTATSAASATKKKATSKGTTAKAGTATAPASASPSASPGKSGSGNTIVDGVKGIIDGVGNLLGLGDDASSSPSASPSPSETPTAEPTTTSQPGPTSTAEPTKTVTAGHTKAGTPKAASASPSATGSPIPCLGDRVLGLAASADDVPPVAAKPGLLETNLLTMYDSTYDGVVNLPTTAGSTIRALKFSMTKAVNKPFSLTIDGPSSSTTAITSDELTTTGTVKFYTERFEGKLFGLIPVVFTPDQPPPLTLPVLWFTDVKIQLNYIRCDQLTGIPLQISEKR